MRVSKRIIKKQVFSLAVYSLIFVSLLLVGFFFWWANGLRSVDSGSEQKVAFVVDRGETVAKITVGLKEEGLIRDSFRFKLLLYFSGLAKKIQAGSYQLSPSMNASEITRILVRGMVDQRITIIEGLRQEQIGEFLREKGFEVDLAQWRQEIVAQSLEGELFPDTYHLPPGATQGAILKIIGRNFEKKVRTGLATEIAQSGLTLDQVLTLASIVERESRVEKDRRIVAGILLKRWRKDWPLQADATVQYALATQRAKGGLPATGEIEWWPKGLSREDIKIASPYNTYLHYGLPPGPICNPGLSAIKAVLLAEDSPYWYYLNDSSGVTHYAKTDEEHADNIGKYLR